MPRRAFFVLTAACGRYGFDTVPGDGVPLEGAPVSDSGPQLALVQQITAGGSGTSLSATLPALPESGNLLIMVGGIQSGPLTSTVGGATWQRAVRETNNTNVEIWYGVADGTSATVDITGATPSSLRMSVQEWRGIDTSVPPDATAVMFGTITPATAGSITCGAAGDLLIFAVADELPNTFGAPTGAVWTALQPANADIYVEQPWYTIGAPAQAFAPTVSETGGYWSSVLAAFRIAPP